MNDVEPRLAIVKIWSAEAARDNDVPLVTICGIGECVRETIKIWNEIDLVLLVAFFSTCTLVKCGWKLRPTLTHHSH